MTANPLKIICAGLARPILNALACGVQDLCAAPAGDAPAVERDASGVPIAWRLFAFGPFSITQDGATMAGQFTPEAADSIMGHFAQKGATIPLDSKHFLYLLAQEMGVDESEVARLLPDGRGTFGYAGLARRDDGLWVEDVQYVPLARRLMAEGIFRYFSPVLRGLSDGALRITSVAFTNNPAMDRLDALAAEAEPRSAGDIDSLAASLDAAVAASANRSKNQIGNKTMNKLLLALASLLGMDSIAMGADNSPPEDVVEKITDLAGEVEKLRASESGRKAFLAAVGDALALGDAPTLETAKAAILGLKAAAGQAADLKAKVDALALEAETRKRDEVVARGVAAGKLSKAMLESEWIKGQDAVALSAFLDFAPVVVPVSRVEREKLAETDSVALSDADVAVCRACGQDPEEVKKAWAAHAAA